MTGLPAPKRLATAVASVTAGLGAVAGAVHLGGLPDTTTAAVAGFLAFGGAAVAVAVQPAPASQNDQHRKEG